MSSPSRVRYTQPDPAGGDVPAHSMVLEWLGNPSHVVGDSSKTLKNYTPENSRDSNATMKVWKMMKSGFQLGDFELPAVNVPGLCVTF